MVGSVGRPVALGQVDQHRAARAPPCTPAGPTGGRDEVAGPLVEEAGLLCPAGRAAERAAAAGAEPGPLVGQRGVGDRPAVVEPAEQVGVGDAHVGHEDLVEQGPTGHLAQRADVDARLVHVDGEVGDALVLRHVGVGAGQQHAEVGDLRARRPHLLAVDDPLVAVADRPWPAARPGRSRRPAR